MNDRYIDAVKKSPSFKELQVHPVTEGYKRAFFGLIQEQADEHSSSITHEDKDVDALWQSIGKSNGYRAFLVVNADQKALAAVTYFKWMNERGAGLYLEDIVTTQYARGKCVGRFAMSNLANLALLGNASYIAWECTLGNVVAHKFYDDINAERFKGREALRKNGLLRQAADETTQRSDGYTARAMEVSDAELIGDLLSNGDDAELSAHLVRDIRNATANDDFVLAVVENREGGFAGAAIANRHFSTFRNVNGLHIEKLILKEKDPAVGTVLLNHLADVQQSKKWDGHLDVTLDQDADYWEPIFARYEIPVLKYGTDPMVFRGLSGDVLKSLAAETDISAAKSLLEHDNNLEVSSRPVKLPYKPLANAKVNELT